MSADIIHKGLVSKCQERHHTARRADDIHSSCTPEGECSPLTGCSLVLLVCFAAPGGDEQDP